MPSVFLSHSSLDNPLARRIACDLQGANIDVWLDEWEILVGDSITQQVQKGLDESEYVGVLLSRDSVISGWVEKEWQSQIGLEASSRAVVILPLAANDCKMPTLLRDKRYADFTTEYNTGLEQLIEAISGHDARRGTAPSILSAPIAELPVQTSPSTVARQMEKQLLPQLSCRSLLQRLRQFPLESQKLNQIEFSIERLTTPISFADFVALLRTFQLPSNKMSAIKLLRSTIQPLSNDEINDLLLQFPLPSTKSAVLQLLS